MNEEYLQHFGILGMKWGIRRYQNEDGSYKSGAEGRYAPDGRPGVHKGKNISGSVSSKSKKKTEWEEENDEISSRADRIRKERETSGYKYKSKDEKGRRQEDESEAEDEMIREHKAKKEAEKRAKKAAEEREAQEWLDDMKKRYENTQREKAEKKAAKELEKAEKDKKKKEEKFLSEADRGWYKTYNETAKNFNKEEKRIKEKYKGKDLGKKYDSPDGQKMIRELDSAWKKLYRNSFSNQHNKRLTELGRSINDMNLNNMPGYNMYDDYLKKVRHSDYSEHELYHHGILGMKWGIRRYQNEDGTLTAAGKKRYREASKDAKEYARAKMYYGEGAGNRRKLIKAKVEEKSKDAGYKEAFDYALSKQDMNKHADAAKRERKAEDIKQGVPRAARRTIAAVGTLVSAAALLHYYDLDRPIIDAGKKAANSVMREIQYQKWKRAI